MRRLFASKDMTYILAATSILLALLVVITAVLRARRGDRDWLEGVFQNTVQRSQLVYTMQINLLASAEAEKSSVMADTDEASQAFAEQSRQAAAAVEKARREFERLLEGDRARQEMDLFRQFSSCWERLQELDREILPLAVQNTNLKALRLSFVAAGGAIKRMEAALSQLMDGSVSSPAALKITRLASEAVTGALNIYVLEAPHIAETTDARMTEIEALMKRLDAQVNDALNNLRNVVDEPARPLVDAARAAYADFQEINAQIIELSRRNSNVRSFAISLGQKRKLTAQCQDLLTALQEAVQGTTFKATR